MNEIEKRKNLKNIARQKQSKKDEVIQNLKYNFKHIQGMWPKAAKITLPEQRLHCW